MWYTGRVSHTQNSSVGKNGSINLELVKSLFSESEEERTREEEKETGSVERGREGGRERLENTQQQSNCRN